MWGERVGRIYWLHVLIKISVHIIKILSVGYRVLVIRCAGNEDASNRTAFLCHTWPPLPQNSKCSLFYFYVEITR